MLTTGPSRKLSTSADATAWWVMPGEPKDVAGWLSDNPPSEIVSVGRGIAVKFDSVDSDETAELAHYEWPQIPSLFLKRLLTAAAVPGLAGSSIVRVDARVQWVLPRPPDERIPASARFLEVIERNRPTGRALTISKPRVVQRIARLVNGLPVVQPEGHACPLRGVSHRLRLTFRSSPDGSVLAKVYQALPGGTACNPMYLRIGGEWQLPLGEGRRVFRALAPMLAAHGR